VGEHPDMALHKRMIACPCPKCNDDTLLAAGESLLERV